MTNFVNMDCWHSSNRSLFTLYMIGRDHWFVQYKLCERFFFLFTYTFFRFFWRCAFSRCLSHSRRLILSCRLRCSWAMLRNWLLRFFTCAVLIRSSFGKVSDRCVMIFIHFKWMVRTKKRVFEQILALNGKTFKFHWFNIYTVRVNELCIKQCASL